MLLNLLKEFVKSIFITSSLFSSSVPGGKIFSFSSRCLYGINATSKLFSDFCKNSFVRCFPIPKPIMVDNNSAELLFSCANYNKFFPSLVVIVISASKRSKQYFINNTLFVDG